ncbi:uncharacterized protein LODBEIA_P02630 [Lodderomyces beijingensis]|uniref:EXS domain-containing protein n=1 Tax=Lodderomyces beijingensis TaxID=1775926 RepID=A0ABP0ZCY0_9ASCO
MNERQGETDAILFKDLIPLPFRILLLIELGLTLWMSLNVILFQFTPINVLRLLNLSYSPHNYTSLDDKGIATGEYATTVPADDKENARLIKGIWSNLKRVAVVNLGSWIVFKLIQYYNKDLKLAYYGIPVLSFGYTVYQLFSDKGATPGQVRIYTTMLRVIRGGISSMNMRTNDILISDTLVSYAKVLNDFGLFIWSYYISESRAYNHDIELVILCIPILIRIKQCWYEYSITGKKQHLYNLLKYSTGLGPLTVNALIKTKLLHSTEEQRTSGELILQLRYLNYWWYFASAVNSTFAFVWDVKMDWSLPLFNKLFNPREKFRVLRSHTVYPDVVYDLAVCIDFFLRYIWVLKLFIINEGLTQEGQFKILHVFSTFLFGYDVYSFGYVVIEVLEIFRRWMWCFIKLESDWVKLKHASEEVVELDQIQKGTA